MFLARRMFLRHVEGPEVEPVVLDVGPLRHRETHVGKDGDDLVGCLADGMHRAVGCGPFRECDIDAFGLETGLEAPALEFLPAPVDGGLKVVLRGIQRLSGLAPRLRIQGAETLHQERDRTLASQCGDTDGVKSGGVPGAGYGVEGVVENAGDAVVHVGVQTAQRGLLRRPLRRSGSGPSVCLLIRQRWRPPSGPRHTTC